MLEILWARGHARASRWMGEDRSPKVCVDPKPVPAARRRSILLRQVLSGAVVGEVVGDTSGNVKVS